MFDEMTEQSHLMDEYKADEYLEINRDLDQNEHLAHNHDVEPFDEDYHASKDELLPYFDPMYWSVDTIPDIQRYVLWHRQHPHCHSPRPLNSDDLKNKHKVRFMYDEHDDNLVYFKVHGYEESKLSKDYQPNMIGSNCNTELISQLALNLREKKHLMRHKYNNQRYEEFDFYDPIYNAETWYSLSVQDQLLAFHSSDNSSISHVTKSTCGSIYDYSIANEGKHMKEDKDAALNILRNKRRKARADVSLKFAGYQGGSPWIQDDMITNALSQLSKEDKLVTNKSAGHVRTKNVSITSMHTHTKHTHFKSVDDNKGEH
jgi:hypothetical protein